VTLAEFIAQTKRQLHEELRAGRTPAAEHDAADLAEARRMGEARMGSHRIAPDSVMVEFLFGAESPTVVAFRVPTPERVVYLPVPEWVVETIWQGDVDGSYHFESHARRLVDAFVAKLEPDENRTLFGPRPPRRRE